MYRAYKIMGLRKEILLKRRLEKCVCKGWEKQLQQTDFLINHSFLCKYYANLTFKKDCLQRKNLKKYERDS